jgi:predicted branched-subunit amino acid permease
MSPILLGVVPFGLVAGIAAIEAGLSPFQAVGFSLIVFAGAAQLAAIELLGSNAPLGIVVLTATVINLRFLMYSASLARHFRNFRARWKGLLAYFLTDQTFAVSVAGFDGRDGPGRRRFYLGCALSLWFVWQVTTVAGVVLGRGVPEEWELSFAVPLIFLALLVPAVDDRPDAVAGIVAGAVAVAGVGLPLNLGLLLAAVVGVTAGVVVEAWPT